ncbi:nuclear transport factor 2 family protein [Actinosynnema sp. NPDC091369]
MSPRDVLEQYRRAAVDQSVDDMRRLYAVDAVHEFPFAFPGAPSRLEGRDAIVDWIAAGWRSAALKYERYRTLAVHDTRDPDTIVVEQEALGTGTVTGGFTLPNVVVLTARGGQVHRLRDYVDVLAAATALGQR